MGRMLVSPLVSPRYLELPAISNSNQFPMEMLYQPFTFGYVEPSLSQTIIRFP